jgi:hypothetical protein
MQKTGIKFGVICGLTYIICDTTALLLGAENQLISTLVGLVKLVATFFVIFYGIKEFRDTVNAGALQVGQAIKLGIMIGFIGALLAAAFSLLYHYVIDPGFMDRLAEGMRTNMEEQGATDEQIEQSMKWMNMFRNPALGAGFVVVWYTFWSFVKGLISGAILKKDPLPPAV